MGTAKKLMFPRIPFKRLTFLKAKMHGGAGGALFLNFPHTPGSAQRGAPPAAYTRCLLETKFRGLMHHASLP